MVQVFLAVMKLVSCLLSIVRVIVLNNYQYIARLNKSGKFSSTILHIKKLGERL